MDEKIITEPRSSVHLSQLIVTQKSKCSCADKESRKILEKESPIECPKHGNPIDINADSHE